MGLSISMVALDEQSRVKASEIPTAWSQRWPKSDSPTGGDKQKNTLSFTVGDCQVIYGLMPAPIPWSDLERLCADAMFWPDATAVMKQHKRHVIVTVMGDVEPVELMKVLTQATIALTDSCNGAVGVYWCNSSHVLAPEDFAEIASEFLPDGLPLPLWMNFRVTANADGTSSGFTQGLAAFEAMELETKNASEPPDELRDRLIGLAEYVLTSGAVINDGDTIGETVDEKISVRYRDSSFGSDGQVMRLIYGNGAGADADSGKSLTTYGCLHLIGTVLCTIAFGYFAYAYTPVLKESFLRHFLIIPLTLVFGFLFLGYSDNLLSKMFGFQAFDVKANREG